MAKVSWQRQPNLSTGLDGRMSGGTSRYGWSRLREFTVRIHFVLFTPFNLSWAWFCSSPSKFCSSLSIYISSPYRQGGANGSIRFDPEINHGANAGLNTALGLLKPIKKKFPEVGWADLMQIASATAVEVAGTLSHHLYEQHEYPPLSWDEDESWGFKTISLLI